MVWPDLVYTEFLCMILWTIFLIVWSIYLKAPIESRPTPPRRRTEQGSLVFPRAAGDARVLRPVDRGVLLPGLIIVGLCAIPYIDKNPKGNGYFTFRERKAMPEDRHLPVRFVVLWVWLIVIAPSSRPNQNFFAPSVPGRPQAACPLINVDLSQITGFKWLHMLAPQELRSSARSSG